MKKPILIVMAKEPIVGGTKTRLTPPLTPIQATALYEALMRDTLEFCQDIPETDLGIAVTPPESESYFHNLSPPGTILFPVTCVDIGDCLQQVMGEALNLGYPGVFAFNSDGPSLPPAYIQRAVRLMDDYDLVLGPGEDGGYYLIGLKEIYPDLFQEIEWSTQGVLTQTLSRALSMRLKVALLPSWYDVDAIQDLVKLQSELYSLPQERLSYTRRILTTNIPQTETS